jgi:hypothetical protein
MCRKGEGVRCLEKPILFNTAMVQAILGNRKTCTRRVVKGNVKNLNIIGTSSDDGVVFNSVSFGYGNINDINSAEIKERIKAPYMPGDILYVRETWLKGDDGYHYKANSTSSSEIVRKEYGYKWKPSIHMPKIAARIFLKVTDVRVEKLQDVKNSDAINEGFCDSDNLNEHGELLTARGNFSRLFDSTLKKEQLKEYGWNANPWVWVIEFETVDLM